MKRVPIFKVGDRITTNLLQAITQAIAELQKLAITSVQFPLQLAGQTLLHTPSQGEGFWAEITGSTTDGNVNRWKYAWSEVYKSAAGYGGWSTLTDGRSGTTGTDPARNTIEDMNTATAGNELGCGVAVNSLDTDDWTFTVSPAPSGAVVWMTEVNQAGNTEYWFSHENGVDGSCD